MAQAASIYTHDTTGEHEVYDWDVMLMNKNAFESNLRVYGHCDNSTHVYDIRTNEFENLENAHFVTVTKQDGSKQRLDVLFAYDSSVSHNKI